MIKIIVNYKLFAKNVLKSIKIYSLQRRQWSVLPGQVIVVSPNYKYFPVF